MSNDEFGMFGVGGRQDVEFTRLTEVTFHPKGDHCLAQSRVHMMIGGIRISIDGQLLHQAKPPVGRCLAVCTWVH